MFAAQAAACRLLSAGSLPPSLASLVHTSVPPAWQADYEALCKKLKEVSALSGISGLLG